MIQPVQTTFRHVHHSDAVVERIQEEADKLHQFFDRITSCRVTLEAPHHHHRKGHPFHVRIELGVPRKELVVAHEPAAQFRGADEEIATAVKGDDDARHEDIYVAIADAFKAMRRQLKDHARTLRDERKAGPAKGD